MMILILLYLLDTYRKFPAKTTNIKKFRFLIVVLIILFIIGNLVKILLPNGSSWFSKGRGQNEGDDTRQTYLNNDGIIIEIIGNTIKINSTEYDYSEVNKGSIQNDLMQRLFNYDDVLLIDNYASSAAYHFVEDILYSFDNAKNISTTTIE